MQEFASQTLKLTLVTNRPHFRKLVTSVPAILDFVSVLLCSPALTPRTLLIGWGLNTHCPQVAGQKQPEHSGMRQYRQRADSLTLPHISSGS